MRLLEPLLARLYARRMRSEVQALKTLLERAAGPQDAPERTRPTTGEPVENGSERRR
jgi:hypothetical protein